MRIRLGYAVRFLDTTSGMELPVPTFPSSFKLTEEILDEYLDAEIADKGVTGGDIFLTEQDGNPMVNVDYWLPNVPTDSLIEYLRSYTAAQLEDGIGEGGFECDLEGKRMRIIPNCDELGTVEVIDDGRAVLGASQIAVAARNGDISRLLKEINAERDAIDRHHQGCTALHLAILYGHPEAVRLLLSAGANPNLENSGGVTPLEVCALSNALSDEQSRDIGQMLLDAGGTTTHVSSNGESAKSYAEARGKRRLAAIL
ncbi:MAG: ankyrin repeat domain-containing protein [Planctomycetaceae bacterium]|nr:ankyrin repeat domain-containing protein [Planctomycetaceae bacterium]